jgi:hypothetical protein
MNTISLNDIWYLHGVSSEGAALMCSYFAPKPKTLQPLPSTAKLPTVEPTAASEHGEHNENEIFTGYLSDEESSESDEYDDDYKELMQTNATSGSSGCTASQIDHHGAGLNMGDLDAEQASFRV